MDVMDLLSTWPDALAHGEFVPARLANCTMVYRRGPDGFTEDVLHIGPAPRWYAWPRTWLGNALREAMPGDHFESGEILHRGPLELMMQHLHESPTGAVITTALVTRQLNVQFRIENYDGTPEVRVEGREPVGNGLHRRHYLFHVPDFIPSPDTDAVAAGWDLADRDRFLHWVGLTPVVTR